MARSGIRRTLGVAVAAWSMVAVAACSAEDSDPPDEDAQPSGDSASELATGDEMDLSVLTYNIEYSGNKHTDAVIEDIDADVVGVLESYDRLPEIAEKTGYPYYNLGLQLLSKYPIHEPSGADGLYALIEVQPGYVVAMFNTHLDYVRYGPRLLLDGKPVAEVLASEDEVRTRSIEVLTPDVGTLLGEGYPVFLTGDLNQPSSLDYTEETIGLHEGVDEVVPWTVSEALLGTGMRDSFREIHPDPVEDPGNTHDNPDFQAGGGGDRIDYLYAGGPAVTRTSELVGEVGGPNVDREYDHWTSDHRAVLSTFDVTPVALRQTLSLERRLLTEGEELGVLYNAPGSTGNTIAVVPEGAGRPTRRWPPSPPMTRRARRRSTPPRSSRPATTSSWWTPRARSSNATPSGCARRRRTSPWRPTRRRTPSASPSRSRGTTDPRTGGTGSGSTRPMRPTPRRTTTCSGATPAATRPAPCRPPSSGP